MHYLYLFIAIVGEVAGTTALKATEGFSKPLPTVFALACYGVAFFMLSLSLERFSIGVLYAVWSGLGIVLIAGFGWAVHGERLDAPALIGLGLIIAGVLTIHLFSASATH
ncbi:MAG: SMR family transporter [Minwuia sp.]|nr:SMR family transporter [Minwuia sp.]